MRKKIVCVFIACVLLCQTATAAAAPFKVGFSITRPDDGVVCSELTYNDQVVWRVQLLCDGAKPVSGGGGGQTTIVVPDIVNGIFMVKIDRQ